MNQRTHRERAGFTLLETMLAAAVGALVVFACVGMFFLMDRTDRAMEARASEQAQLERLRFVMERAFSTLLMSDEPRSTRPGEISVATPAEDLQAAFKDAKPGGARTDRPAGGADRFAGTERFGSDRPASGRSGGTPRPGAKAGDKGRADPAEPAKDGETKAPAGRTPPPPRLILSPDVAAPAVMTRRPTPGQLLEEAQAPQRLELVLFQSPVPTDSIDPVELALNSVRRKRSTLRHEGDAGQPAPQTRGPGVDQPPSATEQQDDAETLSAPVRAVRGAFELRPQPARNAQVPGGQVAPAFLQDNPTGLWQVWWVPMARLDATGLPEPAQDPSDIDAGTIQPVPQPFLVASNLRYVRWTVFHERERKPELASIWSSDLPAYIEVEAQTAAGLSVNWMFEVDWAMGPEVPRPVPTPGGAGGAGGASKDSDKAGGAGDPKSGQPASGASGGAAAKGTK